MQELRIGIVVGEVSGDQLGAGLIRALKAQNPAVRVEGVAGPAMREAGCDVWEDADTLAVMGLVEPIKVLPRLLRLRRSLVKRWVEDPPDVFVGVDAPDFNLGLEKALRRGGITTVHYVSPTVWAWRQGRVRKVAKAVDLVLCIFPFEEEFYKAHDVAAKFIGHPLADSVDTDVESSAITLP
jgi:lipid-A-disaccharide synthase